MPKSIFHIKMKTLHLQQLIGFNVSELRVHFWSRIKKNLFGKQQFSLFRIKWAFLRISPKTK